MYRGSFPAGFPPNFQGPLHGPPRPRFPYPPENRWAMFSVEWCSFIQDFLNEMGIKIASNEISEIQKNCVLCFIGYLWVCIVHEVRLEVDLLVGLLNVQSGMQCVLLLLLAITHWTVLNRGRLLCSYCIKYFRFVQVHASISSHCCYSGWGGNAPTYY